VNYNWSYNDITIKVEKILLFLQNKKIITDDISFLIINSKEKNASVKIVSDNRYEIVITNVFLDYLILHLEDVINLLCLTMKSKEREDDDYSVTYNKIERNINRKKIFELWFNFIFFHELAHILRNHFKVLKHQEIAEFHLSKIMTDRFFFEIDADRIASAMLAPYISNKEEIVLFLESAGYLFHLLYQIDKEENSSQGNYPHPFIRLLFFHQNIYQFSQSYPQLKMQFNLDSILENMEKLFILNQKFYDQKMIEDGLKIQEYRKQYNKFIKNHIEILANGFTYEK